MCESRPRVDDEAWDIVITNVSESVINGDDDGKVTVMLMTVAIVRYYVLVPSRNCSHSSVG